MALKPKMANSVKVDENGYALAELTDVTFLDSDESEYEREQFLFDFLVVGTKKPINLKLWTGTIINGEQYENGKSKDYSKLTRLCIQLGLINEPELKQAYRDGKDIDVDLDSLKGLKVKFKLLKQAKTRNLSQIDLSTLEPVKEPVKQTK